MKPKTFWTQIDVIDLVSVLYSNNRSTSIVRIDCLISIDCNGFTNHYLHTITIKQKNCDTNLDSAYNSMMCWPRSHQNSPLFIRGYFYPTQSMTLNQFEIKQTQLYNSMENSKKKIDIKCTCCLSSLAERYIYIYIQLSNIQMMFELMWNCHDCWF